jgi:NAD(P)-dependent dehydrogenase (short-subunit alcohol dehydrogenase family)
MSQLIEPTQSPSASQAATYGPALITGAGRGIGRAIAVRLAQSGCRLCLCSRTEQELVETAKLVRAAGGEAVCVTCDITDERAGETLVDETVSAFGGLSLLVNNAGGAHWIKPLETLPVRDFELSMDLNLGSVFRLMQQCAPHLLAAAPNAAVVNIASIAARRGLEGMGYYSAAKAAVVALTQATAREWGPRGVRVNAIAPGWITTDLSDPLLSQDSFRNRTLPEIPLRRWGRPEEIAEAAAFLLSPQAAYITGECLTVDGGLLA